MKQLKLYMLITAFAAPLWSAADDVTTAGDGPVFHASMENSDEWTSGQTPNFKRAIYSFTIDGSTFTPCSEISASSAPNPYYAGVYSDGTFYNVVTPEGKFYAYTSHLKTIDTGTWATTDTKSYTNSDMLPFDMTYDYTTQTAYATSPKGGYSSFRGGTKLCTVDLATGEFTEVGETEYMVYALACDGNGQLWGIGTPGDLTVPTYLLKIDKATGTATIVGDTGLNLYTASHSTATFDLRTGKLYWAAKTYTEDEYFQRTWTTALFEVNTATGAASTARLFPTNELMAGLFIKDCHPKAPEAVKDMTFSFSEGSTTEGHIKFTLPTLTYDRTSLSGTLKAEITVDGVTRTIEGLTPGAEFTDETSTSLTQGEHTVKVVCYAGELKSLPAVSNVYGGTDTPAAVSGLTVTGSTRGDKATISWTAPDKGASGGYIDTSALTYDIVLKPDNITVAEGLTDTEYTYTFERKMGISQFLVTPKAGGQSGQAAASDVQLLGTPWALPYLETFNYTSAAYWPFTVIDANGDNDDNGKQWYFDANNRCAIYFADPNYTVGNVDDWLISPTIDLVPGEIYRLQFDTWGYMGAVNHFTVTIGEEATAESQKHVIMDEQHNTVEGQKTFSTLFRPEEGELRLGFHNIGSGQDHMYLDNIYVTHYGTAAIPAAPAIELSMVGKMVQLKGTAPTTTVGGSPVGTLKAIKIYRTQVSSTPLYTIEGIAAGQDFEWIDTNPMLGECKYFVVAVNDEGDGMEATATINTRADVPQAVTGLEVTGKNGWTEAAITWKYPEDGFGVNGLPLNASDITYDVKRTVGVNTVTVAENLTTCSFTDSKFSEAFSNGAQQGYVTYTVTPKTTGGEGASTKSKSMLLGKGYGLPFNESWTEQGQDNMPWQTANASQGASWMVASSGYEPMTGGKGQDGYGLASFTISSSSSSGKADFVSPRIDVADYTDVKVSFYLYRSTDANTASSYLQVGIDTEENGTVMLPNEYRVYGDTNGWQLYTFDLPAEYAGSDRMSLVFRGATSNTKGRVHIDNVSVTGIQPEHEVKAVSITGPEQCLIGNNNIYRVEVTNIGTADNSNVNISFYADGELIETKTIATIASGSNVAETFTLSPSLDNMERYMTLSAVITAENDGSEANNTVEATVLLVAPMLPYVNDLNATAGEDNVYLTWSEATTYPHEETVTDGAESYKAFAISGAGDWKFVDQDGGPTMTGISAGETTLTWTNAGAQQAFIIFNPSLAGDGSIDMTQLIAPRSGKQCFISFAARGGNDDWMISPQLSGRAQTITFYAKAAYPYETEQFEVLASSTTTDINAFSCVSGDSPVGVNSYYDWNKYEYELPEGTKFFAIRCLSQEQTGLMIDDITYSPAYTPLQFWGYNIYRDGVKLTDEPIGDNSFTDKGLPEGEEYGYNVTAVYKEGESIYSNRVTVTTTSEPSSISGTKAGAVSIVSVAGGIVVNNACGTAVSVYSVSGRMVVSIIGTGNDRIPLTPGLYIVKAGDATAKVNVR